MNCFSKNYNFISILFFFLNINVAIADQCPSAETVKERKISREYDWSINEKRSLEDVLAVEKLYSVSIMNRGEFVACYYMSKNRSLRLDGTAIEENCIINKKSGNWVDSENAEQVCKELDLNKCIYEIHCKKVE